MEGKICLPSPPTSPPPSEPPSTSSTGWPILEREAGSRGGIKPTIHMPRGMAAG